VSVTTHSWSERVLRELPRKRVLHTGMRKHISFAAICAATMGAALAQVEASSSVYFIDVDTASYAGPAGQRVALRVGDPPRHVTIGAQDEICVQLQRDSRDSEVIRARVRDMGSTDKVADVRLVAPDISPGTFRSTPWGLLLRALPEQGKAPEAVKTRGDQKVETGVVAEATTACTI